MPYDPQNPEAFRNILKQLTKDHFLSSQTIIDLVLRHRKDTAHLPPFDMTRSTLDRCKQGERIKNIRGLQEIYQFLENDPSYSYCFRAPAPPINLGVALTQFFSAGHQPATYDLSALGDKLVGPYTLYCPFWPPSAPPGSARISLMEITRLNSEFSITETQRYAEFQQHDTGALCSFAKFIYFLMREDAPGTAVKFGLINTVFPHSGGAVEWFRGVLFTSSNLAIFPLSPFFCRRRKHDSKSVDSTPIKIEDIPDEQARLYLREALKPPQ
jgi:hypothetical protein